MAEKQEEVSESAGGLTGGQIGQAVGGYFTPSRHRRLADRAHELGIEEGQCRALYLLLCIGDENVAHDHWHPDKAQFLLETRLEIVKRLELNAPHYPSLGGHWPGEYPDFKTYTYRSG